MLNHSNVVAFIATSKPADAKDFYVSKLGLRFVSDDDFAIVIDAHGVMLRIQKVQELVPRPYTALGWNVENIHQIVETLSVNGVDCERFEWFEQDASGVWQAPGGALVAWFKDPDGNLLSITQLPRNTPG